MGGGQLLRHLTPVRAGNRSHAWIALGLTAASAGLIATGVARPVDIHLGDWGTPGLSTVVALCLSWSLLVATTWVAAHLSARAWHLVNTLAATGLTVVLAHPLIMWMLLRYPQPDWVVCALGLVIPAGAGLLAYRTPLSQWVTGAPQTPRATRSW